MCFFFFKQNTAYEMRISDWSSDVCSSDLRAHDLLGQLDGRLVQQHVGRAAIHLLAYGLHHRRMGMAEHHRPRAEKVVDVAAAVHVVEMADGRSVVQGTSVSDR